MTSSEPSPPHSTLDRNFVLGFCIGQGVNIVRQTIDIQAYNDEVLALVNAFLVQVLQQPALTQEEADNLINPQIKKIADLNTMYNNKELR